jgi:hypothetical protein
MLEARLPLALEAISLAHPSLGTGTGNASSYLATYGGENAVSADGRFVVFQSGATNLVINDDSNGRFSDIFRYDRVNKTTELVSVRYGSPQSGDNGSYSPSISADGRYVVFNSYASNLTAQRITSGEIYVRDMTMKTTTVMSLNVNGTRSYSGYPEAPVISGDGSTIAFRTIDASEIYNYQVFARRLSDASVINVMGQTATQHTSAPRISANGDTVVFETESSLLAADSNDRKDVYARRLSESSVILVSATPSGLSGNGDSFEPSISADGNTIAFISSANGLVPGYSNNRSDIYARRLTESSAILVSPAVDGKASNGISFDPIVSADGSTIAFTSLANNLLPRGIDNNSTADAYARNLSTSATVLVSAQSNGTSANKSSYLADISDDGRFVLFTSYATNLVTTPVSSSISNAYLHDVQADNTRLLTSSYTPGVSPTHSLYFGQQISDNGKTVVLASQSSNLVPNDTNSSMDVFLYRVPTEDFGDAPSNYPVTLASNGARHGITGPRLGSRRDAEADGVTSSSADSDDDNTASSDEDGVTFAPIVAGATGTVTINVQDAPAGAFLDAWIDFAGDGSWTQATDRIANSRPVSNGNNTFTFTVPASTVANVAPSGVTYARFRLSSAGGLDSTGSSPDGEVEDYTTFIEGSPEFAITPSAHFKEGHIDTQTQVFMVTRSHNFSSATVNFTTVDGTALAGSDYIASSGTLTFPAGGPLTLPIPITILGDKILEPTETFKVQLTNPVGGLLGPFKTSNANIENDDTARVALSSVPLSISEGTNGAPTPYLVTVTLLDAVQEGLVISFSTSDLTATVANNDYGAVNQNLSFTGVAGQTIDQTVLVNQDANVETDETFLVRLLNPVTTWGNSAQVVLMNNPLQLTIVNDDMVPPVADAGGPYSIVTGVSLNLNANDSFDLDGFASFEWDLDNDGQFDDANGPFVSLTPSQLTALGMTLGTYPIAVRVTDNTAQNDIDLTTVKISNNTPPIAFANGPYTLNDPMRMLMLNAFGSYDPDGDDFNLIYEWDLNDDGVYDDTFGFAGEMAVLIPVQLVELGLDAAGEYPISLRVTDEAGGIGYDDTMLTIPNTAPTIEPFDIFPPSVAPGTSLFMMAMAMDAEDDSTNLTYAWDLNGDDDYSDYVGTIGDGSLSVPYQRFVDYGYDDGDVFPISVRVSDPFGGVDTLSGNYEVIANSPPVANHGGPYELNGPLREVMLDAMSSTDPDGNALDLTFKWDLDNDGLYDDSDLGSVHLMLDDVLGFGMTRPGIFPISLQATDIYGKSSTKASSIVINNSAPTSVFVMIPPGEVNQGDTVMLMAQATDPDDFGLGITYTWDLDFDGEFDDAVGESLNLTHGQLVNFGLNGGIYTIAVRATDPFGESVVAHEMIEIGVNQLPLVDAGGPYELEASTRGLMLDGSMSIDPDGDSIALIYAWDLDNDGEYDDAFGDRPSLILDELLALGIKRTGAFPISLRATDMDGANGYASTVVNVVNTPPQVFNDGPFNIAPFSLADLTLTSSAIDAEDEIVTLAFEWDLDLDGTYDDATGETALVTVEDIRRFGLLRPTNTVSLRVTDPFGAVSISDVTITVQYDEPIYVTSALDVIDPLDDPAVLTLREAISLANERIGPDVIVLPADIYQLTINGADEEANLKGDLDIIDDLVILGAGAGQTVIDASLISDRVIDSQFHSSVLISGVTITGGSLLVDNTPFNRDAGAGVFSDGQLTLIDSVVNDNAALFGLGGGVYTGGTLRVVRSTIEDNESLAGGGIAANYSVLAEVHIVDSAIINNDARIWGGGVYSGATPLIITGSTLSGNATTESFVSDFLDEGGGGIYVAGGLGTAVSISESTIANNTATRNGGGVLIESSVTLGLRNTIIADNSAPIRSDIDANTNSLFQSLGNNLIGIADAGLFTATTGDFVGTLANPVLAGLSPLANYGGRTMTHNLESDSPALDAGAAIGKRYDQRGTGFPRLMGLAQDIGATEAGDDDKISNEIENGAPNDGDGNADGILDSLQLNVASFPNSGNSAYVTISSTGGTTMSDIAVAPIPFDAPIESYFEVGLLDFTIREVPIGGATTVTILLDPDTQVNTYYKFGPTPEYLTPHWYEFLYDETTGTGAVIENSQITVYLIDGARGDDDLTQNGVIVDPGIPGFDQLPVIHSLYSNTLAQAGDAVPFSASVIDPGSSIDATIEWDFGDGSPVVPDDLFPVHVFETAGTFIVTLTATDWRGREVTETTTLEVLAPPVDVPSDVNLSVTSSTAAEENATTVTVTATADSEVSGDQTVDLDVTGMGITSSDYALSNVTITIPDGQTTGSVTFTVLDDLLNEGDETATLTISNPSAGLALGATTSLNVTITDDDNAGASNFRLPSSGAYRIVLNGGTVELRDAEDDVVATRALGTEALNVHGTTGADSLTIDLSGGDVIPADGIDFHGGDPSVNPGDALNITGDAQGTVTYHYTSASDGSVAMSNYGTVTYTGLEQISNTGTATDVIFNLPAGPNAVTLNDDANNGNGLTRLFGATIAQTIFASPSSSVAINRGSASDEVAVLSSPDLKASLTIGAVATPFDHLSFQGFFRLASGNSLAAYSNTTEVTSTARLYVQGEGSIELVTANLEIAETDSVLDSDGVVAIAPQSGGRVEFGVADGVNVLGLTNEEIARITAATLEIGSADTGNITVLAPFSFAGHLSLNSGVGRISDVLFSAAKEVITAPSLSLSASHGIRVEADVDTLTNAQTSNGGIGVELFDADNGGVEVQSVSAPNGSISIIKETSGNIVLTNATASAGITVEARGPDSTIFHNNGTLLNTGNTIELIADKMRLDGATIDSGIFTTILRPYDSQRAIELGVTLQTGANALEIDQGSLQSIVGSRIKIGGATTGGAITLVGALNLPGKSLSLETNSGVSDGTIGRGGHQIIAENLSIEVTGDIDLNFNVDYVSTRGNNQFLEEADSTFFNLDAGSGTITLDSGNFNLFPFTGGTGGGEGGDEGGDEPSPISDVIEDQSSVIINSPAVLLLNDNIETIGSLAGDGTVDLGNGALIVAKAGASTTFEGTLTGVDGSLGLFEGVILTLAGDQAYTGLTYILNGKLIVDGTMPLGSGVFLESEDSTLSGKGRILQSVNIQGGTLAPGNDVGILETESVTFGANSRLQVEIGGDRPGEGAGNHDQLNSSGEVTIGSNVSLELSSFDGGAGDDFMPTPGQSFTIIRRNGGSGSFAGLPEGSTITNFLGSGLDATISYQGGDGDDVVITVITTLDVTAPTSTISSLAANATSLLIPVSVNGNDPAGPLGNQVSRIMEYDLFVAVDSGSFTKFATVPASEPTTTYQASSNHTYFFKSLARDNAGNVEVKNVADAFTRTRDFDKPITQVITATPSTDGLFSFAVSGTEVGGSQLVAFDLYVIIDNEPAQWISSIAGGTPNGSGVYSGTSQYQAPRDDVEHSYRFYTVGRDTSGNVEETPASGDVVVANRTFMAPATLQATGTDVQKGANQRSFIRYVDINFNTASGVDALETDNSVLVERYMGGSWIEVSKSLRANGTRLEIDFGEDGLVNDGYYRVSGNDFSFDFHRLLGDADGDAVVTQLDTAIVDSFYGQLGSGLDGDLDGDGVVGRRDKAVTQRSYRGRTVEAPPTP